MRTTLALLGLSGAAATALLFAVPQGWAQRVRVVKGRKVIEGGNGKHGRQIRLSAPSRKPCLTLTLQAV